MPNRGLFTFRPLKYNSFCKSYHKSNRVSVRDSNSNPNPAQSSGAKTTRVHQSPAFFDSSYEQHLRQTHGLITTKPREKKSNFHGLEPHLVLCANTNYNIVDDVLAINHTSVTANKSNDRRRENLEEDEYDETMGINLGLGLGLIGIEEDRHRYLDVWNRRYSNVYSKRDDTTRDLILSSVARENALSSVNVPVRRYTTTTAATNLPGEESNFYVPPDVGMKESGGANAGVEVRNTTTPASITMEFDSQNPWEEDKEEALNPETFLETHIKEIDQCYEKGQFDRINSLYHSLRRNDIVPPIDTYEKILESFDKRTFDVNNKNLNAKVFELLNCYQDILGKHLKPTARVYNTLLYQIFKNSVVAYESGNGNGPDFFKIGADLLLTVYKNNELTDNTLNYFLFAMNLYPSSPAVPSLSKLKDDILAQFPKYRKSSFYFMSLVNLGKLQRDVGFLKDMYKDFSECLRDPVSCPSLLAHQFEVYSMFVSGFTESAEVDLANKILQNVLKQIKARDSMKGNVELLISNYLISLSRLNPTRAYSLLLNFRKLDWVPEFSYDFYLRLMANCFNDWELVRRIYDYILPLGRTSRKSGKSNSLTTSTQGRLDNLSNYLLYPIGVDGVLDQLLDRALELNDRDLIFKLLQESVVKKFPFNAGLYHKVFQFLSKNRSSKNYLMKFITAHGNMLVSPSRNNINDAVVFLNAIVESFRNQELISEIVRSNFFKSICQGFEFTSKEISHYRGMMTCFQTIWGSPKTFETYPLYLELHAILITRLYDFDTYTPADLNGDETGRDEVANFKGDLVKKFEALVTNFRRMNWDPNAVNGVVAQAIKLTDLPYEYVEYFVNPGDWDKSYPLSLGSMMRNSHKTGFKEYQNLLKQGYCFDYDTYKELLKQGYATEEIVDKCFELVDHNDAKELSFLCNLIIRKINSSELESRLFLSGEQSGLSQEKVEFFQRVMLPFISDKSLVRLVHNLQRINLDTQFLPEIINFPEAFRSISSQAEYKESIVKIYETLFQQRRYDSILAYNKVCPALDLELLLKSAVRSGNNAEYQSLFQELQGGLDGEKLLEIQCEFFINNLEFEKLSQLIGGNNAKKGKLSDYIAFANFLRSFLEGEDQCTSFSSVPQNTLQLSNNLSAFTHFSSLLTYYDEVLHSGNVSFVGQAENKSIVAEVDIHSRILDQMLNNLVDATGLLYLNVEKFGVEQLSEIYRNMRFKLDTFFRFKTYLKSRVLETSDMEKLLFIWARVDPGAIDSLFNNLAETVYLSPNLEQNTLYLKYGLVWNFDRSSLETLTGDILAFYEELGDTNRIRPVSEFQELLTGQRDEQQQGKLRSVDTHQMEYQYQENANAAL